MTPNEFFPIPKTVTGFTGGHGPGPPFVAISLA